MRSIGAIVAAILVVSGVCFAQDQNGPEDNQPGVMVWTMPSRCNRNGRCTGRVAFPPNSQMLQAHVLREGENFAIISEFILGGSKMLTEELYAPKDEITRLPISPEKIDKVCFAPIGNKKGAFCKKVKKPKMSGPTDGHSNVPISISCVFICAVI